MSTVTDLLYRDQHPIVLPVTTAADDLADYLRVWTGQPAELEQILTTLARGTASALVGLAVAADTAAVLASRIPGDRGLALEDDFLTLRNRLLEAQTPKGTPAEATAATQSTDDQTINHPKGTDQ